MPLQGRFFGNGCIRVEKKIKVTILILSILLGLSLLALAGTLIRARLTDSDPGAVTVPDNLITPEEDTGTAGAAGYCSVQVGNEVYYTEPIFVGGEAFSFTITGDPGAEIQLTPKWGSCAVREEANTVKNGSVITATGSQLSSTQSLSNTGTADMTTAQAEPTEPTEPTAPAAPESSEAGPTAAPEDTASDSPAGREPEKS